MKSDLERQMADRFEAIVHDWQPGSRVSNAIVNELRRDHDDALFIFQWSRDIHTYGLRLSMRQPFREFGYGDRLSTWEEWVDSFQIALMSHLDTGLVENSRRVGREDYIELQPGQQWNYAVGYDADVTSWTDETEFAEVTMFTLSAFDYKRAVTARVSRTGPTEGRLSIASKSSSAHVMLDAAHLVCHLGASEGLAVITSEFRPHLSMVGFRPNESGGLRLDTSFLEEEIVDGRFP